MFCVIRLVYESLCCFKVQCTINCTTYEFPVLGDYQTYALRVQLLLVFSRLSTMHNKKCNVQLRRAYAILCQIAYLTLITCLLLSPSSDYFVQVVLHLIGVRRLLSLYLIPHVMLDFLCCICSYLDVCTSLLDSLVQSATILMNSQNIFLDSKKLV